jgi:hypothetical protein
MYLQLYINIKCSTMNNFEGLGSIDNYVKVLIEKNHPPEETFEKTLLCRPSEGGPMVGCKKQLEIEDPLVDIFDEEDHVRILVQCHCREQQVTFHPSSDGIIICRKECHREKGGQETCKDVCSKLRIRTDELQIDNMLFVIAKCNNNNTLEAMIPKLKK